MQANFPLDIRSTVPTYSDLSFIQFKYVGLFTFVEDLGTYYYYTTQGWEELSTTSQGACSWGDLGGVPSENPLLAPYILEVIGANYDLGRIAYLDYRNVFELEQVAPNWITVGSVPDNGGGGGGFGDVTIEYLIQNYYDKEESDNRFIQEEVDTLATVATRGNKTLLPLTADNFLTIGSYEGGGGGGGIGDITLQYLEDNYYDKIESDNRYLQEEEDTLGTVAQRGNKTVLPLTADNFLTTGSYEGGGEGGGDVTLQYLEDNYLNLAGGEMGGLIVWDGTTSDNWNEAYSWGDHKGLYLTEETDTLDSVAKRGDTTEESLTADNFLTLGSEPGGGGTAGDVTIVYLQDNYYDKDTSDARYIQEEEDPTVPSYVKEITDTQINNWDEAYSWGNWRDGVDDDYLSNLNVAFTDRQNLFTESQTIVTSTGPAIMTIGSYSPIEGQAAVGLITTNTQFLIRAKNGSLSIQQPTDTESVDKITVSSAGKVGINTPSPEEMLHIDGNALADNFLTIGSDDGI